MIRMLEERARKSLTAKVLNIRRLLEVVEHASLFAEELQDYPMAPTLRSYHRRVVRSD